MAEKNEKKKMTKNTTTKKTAGKTSPKKSTVTKAKTGSTKNGTKKLTLEEQQRLEKIKRREQRINHLILAVVLLALSLFLFISMYTKVAGIVGKGISYVVLGLFGYMGYVLPIYFLIYSVLLIINKGSKKGKKETILFTIGFFILLSAAYSINRLNMGGSLANFSDWLEKCFSIGTTGKGGGFIGMFTAFALTKLIGKGGAYITTIACMIIAALITMNRPFEWLISLIFKVVRVIRKKAKRKKMLDDGSGYDQIVCYGGIDDKYLCDYKYPIDDYDEEDIPQDYENDESGIYNKKRITDFIKFDGMGKKISKEEKLIRTAKSNKRSKTEKTKATNIFNKEKELENEFSDEELEKIKERFGDNSTDKDETYTGNDNKPESFSELYNIRDDEQPFLSWINKNNGKNAFVDENITDDFDLSKPVSKEETEKVSSPEIETYGESDKKTKSGNSSIFARGMDMMKADIAKSVPKFTKSVIGKKNINYSYPPLELLKSNYISSRGNEAQELNQKAVLLENTLKSFNVNAKVIKVSRGPAVTRFEVQPATGVKVNSIVRLQDDIALNLEARSIRMEAPIPGKAAVGIEIENDEKKAVLLREVVESGEFMESKSKITFAVGRDISGNSIVANLKDMPHLLIAGSTGSGKSVCVNSIIMSILYKAKPDEVRFIMVDPKVVELSNYNGIPHLLIPVVTEASKAAAALNWAVKEMEDRYRKFQEAGVRELASYNRKAGRGSEFEKMPQIVIIIDELADLMMAAPQQVEDAICRLAQKARAAGMHLIVATQRPSVDVITGVIKANIPSRIAFAVSSQIDSRTILDGSGAEKLVGKGDMLFSPLGMGKPLRVQGTFVSDEEVQSVIDYVSNQGHEQEFSNDLMDTIETSKMSYNDDEVDELLKDAIEHIVNVGQASVSMLQRRFRIGYNRAARLVDMMEERGIVGPQDGSRPRKVFLTKEGLAELDKASKDVFLDNGYMNDNNDCLSDYDSDGVPEEI